MISGRFLRFAVAGAIGFIVDSLVLLAMTKGLGLSPYVGRAISFPTALTTTWLINRAWAFRQAAGKTPKDLFAEYLNYWAVQMTGGAVNLAAFALFVTVFGKTGLSQVAGVTAGSVAGMFVNYFGNKALVFGANETVARMQRWTQRAAWIAVGTLILLIPAMLNAGPFINYDSDQYFTIGRSIAGALGDLAGLGGQAGPAASQGVQPTESVVAPAGAWGSSFSGARSPFYSLFLYLTAFDLGLWGNAVLQSLPAAWLLALLSAEFGKGFRPLPYLLLTAGLTLVSTAGFFVAWPMPDVFAGVFLLAALLFLLGARVNRLERMLLWGLMALSASFHTTINLLALAIAVIGAAVLWWSGRRPVAALAAGALAALAIAPGMLGNQIYETAAKKIAGVEIYSPPFLTARVIGDGTGQRFLAEQCPTGLHDFEVCRFSGRTFTDNNQFLWGTSHDPSAYQTSEVAVQRRLGEEQFDFAFAVVRTYPGQQLAASARNVLRQVQTVNFGADHLPLGRLIREWPDAPVFRLAPQYERCLADPQTCGKPRFIAPWQGLITLAFHACLLLALGHAALALRKPASEEDRKLLALTLVLIPMLLINAAICGVLSGVSVRYQARIAWVLPALVLAAWPVIWARVRKPPA